jgi:hypothetical protein
MTDRNQPHPVYAPVPSGPAYGAFTVPPEERALDPQPGVTYAQPVYAQQVYNAQPYAPAGVVYVQPGALPPGTMPGRSKNRKHRLRPLWQCLDLSALNRSGCTARGTMERWRV